MPIFLLRRKLFILVAPLFLNSCIGHLLSLSVNSGFISSFNIVSTGSLENLNSSSFLHPGTYNQDLWDFNKIQIKEEKNDNLWEFHSKYIGPHKQEHSNKTVGDFRYEFKNEVKYTGLYFQKEIFNGTIFSLRHKEKYFDHPKLLETQEDLSFHIINTILSKSLKEFSNQHPEKTILVENILNQIDAYLNFEKRLEKSNKAKNDNPIFVFSEAVKANNLSISTKDRTEILSLIEIEQKNIESDFNLVGDSFTIKIKTDLHVLNTNGSNKNGEVVWEIDFYDININDYELYVSSIRIFKFRILISIILLAIMTYIWIKFQNKNKLLP